MSPRPALPNANGRPPGTTPVARFEVTVEFRPAETRTALERLVARMERAHPQPWELSSLGQPLRAAESENHRLPGARAGVRATFKLGQDERRSTLGEILEHLGDPPLVQWMREFNT